jgi:GH24 family phage-related lysozyme (muramidase)
MKTFKTYLEERNLFTTGMASLAIASAALGGQSTKPEALEIATHHIKGFEGFESNTYVDKHATGNPLAIGYGITSKYPDGSPVKMGDKVTEPEAHEHLKQHIDKHVIPKLEKIPNWGEMDAHKQASLIGFAYNTGGGFYGSKGYQTISTHLKNKEWDKVDDAMKLYNKSGGKVLNGLVRRRDMEANLWNKGSSAQPATTTQQTTQPTPQTVAPSSLHHTVSSGDNLSKIADKYKTSVKDILDKNPELKKNPNKIMPNQKIRIR